MMQPSADPPKRSVQLAGDLRELELLLRLAAAEIFGAEPFSLVLMLPAGERSGAPVFLTCNRQTLSAERHFELLPATPRLTELLRKPTGCRLVETGPADLVRGESILLKFAEDGPGHLLCHIAGDGGSAVAVLLELPPSAPAPSDDAIEEFCETVKSSAGTARRIADFELAETRSRLLLSTHDKAMRFFGAEDPERLAELLAETLDRQFGFDRRLVAFVHAPSSTLRCQLHEGFDKEFLPGALPLEPTDDFLGEVAYEGRAVRLDDRVLGQLNLAPLIGDLTPVHGLIAPLRLEMRTVGLVYVDSPRHELATVFPDVLETCLSLAAAAVDSLNRRLSAESRAETDPLTGAFNRHYLDRILELEVPRVRRYKSPISLLMIDLCDFKQVNDTWGHVFGDYILRETANLIRSNVREPDVVVRYGGDEFVVLMINTSDEQAQLVKNRIERAFIERNKTQEDEKMIIDISIGLRSADESTIETLLEDADRAMYEHKAERKRDQIARTLLGFKPSRPDAVDKVVSSLLNNLRAREPWYPDHSRRVSHLALIIARNLGFAPDDLQVLVLGALLHDVGKASLPTEVLRRPGPLNPSEYRAVQGHALIGEEFLSGLPHLVPVRPLIRHHHERFDGRTTGRFPGYPHGLSGEQIPLGARILKLADSFDTMISGRPWQPARSLEDALREVRQESGASFDPSLVKILEQEADVLRWMGDPARLETLYSRLTKQDLAERAEAPAPGAHTLSPAS